MWEDVYGQGRRFFEVMAQNADALKYLDYNSSVQFDCGEHSFRVRFQDRKVAEIAVGSHGNGAMDVTLIAEAETFSDLFRARVSPATLLYHGRIRIPAQKGKHSLIAAIFQAMRRNQEDLYKADWKTGTSGEG